MQRLVLRSARWPALSPGLRGQVVNPEKSLVATIRGTDQDEPNRHFGIRRYRADLTLCGRILGQHEIATVQTTSIDQGAGINLTTVRRTRGENGSRRTGRFCAMSETATPHRMGASLTYARRYACSRLLGITGEDDLDAPDLTTPTNLTPSLETPNGNSHFPRSSVIT